MAKKVYEEKNIRAIAERIRRKTGTDKLYKVSDMPIGIDEVFAAGGIVGEAGNLLCSLIDKSVTAIIIPDGVSVIGGYSFYGCSSLASITIPDSVSVINGYAFCGCSSLASIVIPNSVTSIGNYAFAYCNNCLEYNFSKCTSVPSLQDTNAFLGINNNAKILVPAALYNEWINATNWTAYKEHIFIAPSEGLLYSYGGVYNVIGRGSCKDSTIVIPETYDDGVHGEHPVKYISDYNYETCEYVDAFKNDQTLEEIILPETGCVINGYPFEGSSLKVIKNFYDCTSFALYGLNLEYVSFLDGVGINSWDFCDIVGSPVYDFSRHTSVAELSDVSYISVGENTKILVPAALYDEWISATNWTVYKEHIFIAPSTGLLYEYYSDHYRVIGRGSCTDSTIIIPATYDDGVNGEHPVQAISYYTENEEMVGAFENDRTIEEIILPETGCYIKFQSFKGSSLKVLRNYSVSDSFVLSGLEVEYVSFLDGANITGYALTGITGSPVYDFSRHTSVAELTYAEYISVGENTEIIVPSFLYDRWTSATNWTVYKDYIVPKDVKAPPMEDNFDVFIGAEALQETINTAFTLGLGNNEILYDNGIPYLRIYGDGSSPEAYSYITDIEGKVTGKFLVFAYRLPVGNIEVPSYIDVYTNTSGLEITGNGDRLSFSPTIDEKWQVAVIDIEEAISNSTEVVNGTATSKFIANSDGTYGIKNFRLDWFNQITSTDSYIDIAYIGICGSLEKARQADANYTGKCYEPDDFVSKLGASKAVKGSYNGMPYVTITDTTQASGEQFVELYKSDHILPDTSRYIGILYRNAPGQHAEVYISSDNVNWIEHCQINYDVSDGWHFGVMAIGSDIYHDSVCRRLRFDYFNNLSASTEYSIDIGFVKFFGTEEEANEYYKTYKVKYDLN